MRVLLGAQPTVGHTQALRAVAAELRKRGHETEFAVPSVWAPPRWLPMPVPEPLRVAAAVVESLRAEAPTFTTPMSWEGLWAGARVARARGYDELEWACRVFTAGAGQTARRIAAHLRARRIDLVVGDFAFFGVWLGAELAGVPHAALYHSGLPFPSDDGVPFGSGLSHDASPPALARAHGRLREVLALVDERLGAARRALGLAPHAPGLLARPYGRRLNVLTTFEALEPARGALAQQAAGPLLYSGPCLGARVAGAAPDFPWQAVAGPGPWVLVSLGTVFNAQPRLYEVLLEGVHLAGARAVVAAGASLPAVRAVAARDDVVARFVPQVELLARVDAFVTHGGNNSTNEALQAGTPLVVVPFGAEQRSNAQRVTALGVGAGLDAARLTAADVAREVKAALSPARRARARALAAGLPAGDGAPRVVDALLG